MSIDILLAALGGLLLGVSSNVVADYLKAFLDRRARALVKSRSEKKEREKNKYDAQVQALAGSHPDQVMTLSLAHMARLRALSWGGVGALVFAFYSWYTWGGPFTWASKALSWTLQLIIVTLFFGAVILSRLAARNEKMVLDSYINVGRNADDSSPREQPPRGETISD